MNIWFLRENIAMKNLQAYQKQIKLEEEKNINNIYDNLKLVDKLNKIMDIEERLFETLDIVEVAMNNDEVDMNNENN